jgi:hypothetical protein
VWYRQSYNECGVNAQRTVRHFVGTVRFVVERKEMEREEGRRTDFQKRRPTLVIVYMIQRWAVGFVYDAELVHKLYVLLPYRTL